MSHQTFIVTKDPKGCNIFSTQKAKLLQCRRYYFLDLAIGHGICYQTEDFLILDTKMRMTRASKYEPLRLLEEDLLYGKRVRRVRDKSWIVVLGSSIIVLVLVVFHVKSRGIDFQPMRHPLSSTHVPKNDSEVRYLTFGTYDTHGHGLGNFTKAYPYLSSQDVHNAALHLGGPALGAVCTQSMTGQGIYDVVVLDFSKQLGQGFQVLARRLRNRFPNALFIILRRWSPEHISHYPLNGTQVDATTWIKERNIPSFHTQNFLDAFNTTDPQDWIYSHRKDAFLSRVVEQIDARLVELPKPKSAATALVDFMDLFHATALGALSERGHKVVADLIQSVVDKEDILSQGLSIRNEVGTWGQGDSCHMWYQTGVLDESMYAPPTKMVRFAKKRSGYKYALEFPSDGGSISIQNPFKIPRALYLTFTTTASSLLPRVEVMVGDQQTIVLETNDQDAVLPRTVIVGFVNPGKTVVHFKPLSNSMKKFHLTGGSLLGTTEVPFERTLEEETDYGLR